MSTLTFISLFITVADVETNELFYVLCVVVYTLYCIFCICVLLCVFVIQPFCLQYYKVELIKNSWSSLQLQSSRPYFVHNFKWFAIFTWGEGHRKRTHGRTDDFPRQYRALRSIAR